jgi:hypothetical protein
MQAPKLPSFFRQNTHKRFEFSPRFYDERKERLEKMRRKYREKSDSSEREFDAGDLRMRISTEWRRGSRSNSGRNRNFRLLIIIMALVLLTYLILFR